MAAVHKTTSGERRQMIAEVAYLAAERRGFAGGDAVGDWVEAEAAVDARLRLESEHVLERLEVGLATATKKLAAAKEKFGKVSAEAREEWQQDLDRLASLRDMLSKKLRELRAQGTEVSDRARRQAEKAWDEITEVIQRLGSPR
jgi:chromosome segregation ATPase